MDKKTERKKAKYKEYMIKELNRPEIDEQQAELYTVEISAIENVFNMIKEEPGEFFYTVEMEQ